MNSYFHMNKIFINLTVSAHMSYCGDWAGNWRNSPVENCSSRGSTLSISETFQVLQVIQSMVKEINNGSERFPKQNPL